MVVVATADHGASMARPRPLSRKVTAGAMGCGKISVRDGTNAFHHGPASTGRFNSSSSRFPPGETGGCANSTS